MIRFIQITITLLILACSGYTSFSQRIESDSIIEGEVLIDKRHSPTKAVVLSAVLPGLGQAYNKKYWKIPIIYAGFAAATYGFIELNQKFKCNRDAYRLQIDDDPNTIGECENQSSSSNLRTLRDFYKRNLDLVVIGSVVWYCLNLVDAAVDAHLYDFNVSDDLTIGVNPNIQFIHDNHGQLKASAGISINFDLNK